MNGAVPPAAVVTSRQRPNGPWRFSLSAPGRRESAHENDNSSGKRAGSLLFAANRQGFRMFRPLLAIAMLALVAACAGSGPEVARETHPPGAALYPGETPQMRVLVNNYAAAHDIPPALLHRVIQRESDYNAAARNGPYYGLMQILPETARTMGYEGPAEGLLDAGTNLEYAGAYLRGAWLLSGGDIDGAVRRYASGYYYEARDRCMLVATGLRTREIARNCS